MAVAATAEATTRPQFVRVVHGEIGEVAYFNLDCALHHLSDAIIATCCPGRADAGVTIDLASEKGKLFDLMGASRGGSERAADVLKPKATLLLFEVHQATPGSTATLGSASNPPSRPTSGRRPSSGRRSGGTNNEAVDDSGTFYTPLVGSDYLASQYPGLELTRPGGGRVPVGAAGAKPRGGRRASKSIKR